MHKYAAEFQKKAYAEFVKKYMLSYLPNFSIEVVHTCRP